MVLQNNLVSKQGATSPFHLFFGKGTINVLNTVQRFSEICVIAIHAAITNKMKESITSDLDLLKVMLPNVITC